MEVPNWWEALLLLAAAYRLWRLVAYDTITEGLRTSVLDRLDMKQHDRWSAFLFCPWCLGFWMTLGWWVAWQIWPHATLVVAGPFAMSLAVGIIGSRIDTE